MNLSEWVARKKEHLRALGRVEIRNITPSVRDFTAAVTTHKRALAVVVEGTSAAALSGAEALMRYEHASVAALSVPTDEIQLASSFERLRDIDALHPPFPLLCRDLFVSKEQVYLARLAGADAIELRANILEAHELKSMIDIAASMHMACTVEVSTEEDGEKAMRCGARLWVVSAWGEGQTLAPEWAVTLARSLPRLSVCIVRGPFSSLESLETVRAVADAVWLDSPQLALSWESAGEAWLRAFIERADNGPGAADSP